MRAGRGPRAGHAGALAESMLSTTVRGGRIAFTPRDSHVNDHIHQTTHVRGYGEELVR